MPAVPYAQKMSQKTNCGVLSVLMEDPSTKEGMVNVCKSYLKYVPVISDSEHIRAKVLTQGMSVCSVECTIDKTKKIIFQVTKVS